METAIAFISKHKIKQGHQIAHVEKKKKAPSLQKVSW